MFLLILVWYIIPICSCIVIKQYVIFHMKYSTTYLYILISELVFCKGTRLTNNSTSCLSSSLKTAGGTDATGESRSTGSASFCDSGLDSSCDFTGAGWLTTGGSGGLVSSWSGEKDWLPSFCLAVSCRALSRWSCCLLRLVGAGLRPRPNVTGTAWFTE